MIFRVILSQNKGWNSTLFKLIFYEHVLSKKNNSYIETRVKTFLTKTENQFLTESLSIFNTIVYFMWQSNMNSC